MACRKEVWQTRKHNSHGGWLASGRFGCFKRERSLIYFLIVKIMFWLTAYYFCFKWSFVNLIVKVLSCLIFDKDKICTSRVLRVSTITMWFWFGQLATIHLYIFQNTKLQILTKFLNLQFFSICCWAYPTQYKQLSETFPSLRPRFSSFQGPNLCIFLCPPLFQ